VGLRTRDTRKVDLRKGNSKETVLNQNLVKAHSINN